MVTVEVVLVVSKSYRITRQRLLDEIPPTGPPLDSFSHRYRDSGRETLPSSGLDRTDEGGNTVSHPLIAQSGSPILLSTSWTRG